MKLMRKLLQDLKVPGLDQESARNILETYCKNETNEAFIGLARALICLPKSHAARTLESFLFEVDRELTVGDVVENGDSFMFELESDQNTYIYSGRNSGGVCLFEKIGTKDLFELDMDGKVRRIF